MSEAGMNLKGPRIPHRVVLKNVAVLVLCCILLLGGFLDLTGLQENAVGLPVASAAPDPLPFTDIRDHWAEEFIVEAAELDIARGYPDRTFRPAGYVSRAEFATMIMRTAGIPGGAIPLSSTSGGRRFAFRDKDLIPVWARESVGTLAGLGVITGYEDKTFRANLPVTNSEAAVIVDRVLSLLDPSLKSAFGVMQAPSGGSRDSGRGVLSGTSPRLVAPPCHGEIPEWAQNSILKLYTMGILTFPGNLFAPHARTTRAEAAAWLCGLHAYRVLAEKKGTAPGWSVNTVCQSGRNASQTTTGDAMGGDGSTGDGTIRNDEVGDGAAGAVRTASDAKAASFSGAAGTTHQDKGRFMVMAYYASDFPGDTAAHTSLSAHAGSGAIDAVGAFLHPINARGLIAGKPDPSLMNLARKNGRKVLAVVHNFTDGGFSRQVASSILANPKTRGAATGSIVWILNEYGYDGVNVDLENIDPDHRDEYVAFLAELAQKMRGSGKLLTVCVPGKTWDAPKDQWAGAFDYAKIGRVADKVVIMAYDEHWVGGNPGPVASITWVQNVVKYATKTISPDRILLGLAAYGYDWPTSGGKAAGTGRMLGEPYLAEVARSSRATIMWDDRAQVPYFKYWRGTQERTVYFENRYSAAFKIALARKSGLGGVAVWRLGLEDPELWGLLSKY